MLHFSEAFTCDRYLMLINERPISYSRKRKPTECILCEKEKHFFLQVLLLLPIENILAVPSGNRTPVFCSARLELKKHFFVGNTYNLLPFTHIHTHHREKIQLHHRCRFSGHNIITHSQRNAAFISPLAMLTAAT